MHIVSITYQDEYGWFLFEMNSGEKLRISYDLYMELSLHQSDEVPSDIYERLRADDERLRAFLLGRRFALYQPRTEGEVRQRLMRDHISSEIIEDVLLQLRRLHLLDDQKYAELYVQEKVSRQHWSRRRIQHELFRKGVPANIIEQALSIISRGTESETIREIVQKKYAHRDLNDRKMFDRTVQSLINKGFSLSLILPILKERQHGEE